VTSDGVSGRLNRVLVERSIVAGGRQRSSLGGWRCIHIFGPPSASMQPASLFVLSDVLSYPGSLLVRMTGEEVPCLAYSLFEVQYAPLTQWKPRN
jgi:hypothetical protein